eukprot:5349767-Karenia_brevis.AAC.1
MYMFKCRSGCNMLIPCADVRCRYKVQGQDAGALCRSKVQPQNNNGHEVAKYRPPRAWTAGE